MPKELTDDQVQVLQKDFWDLPQDYFEYLRLVGWGESPSGRMIYSGPVPAQDVYGESIAAASIILLGDDTQGYCIGFDRKSKQLGEISDSGVWEPWAPSESFSEYANASN